MIFYSLSFLYSADLVRLSDRSISLCSGKLKEGTRVTGCGKTTRYSSKKFISMGKWHSSSFLSSYARSRYVSQVSFSSFILCICIAHHSIILNPSFCRSIGFSLRQAIKFNTHFGFNIKPLSLKFHYNRTPFVHLKHWPATQGKTPPLGKVGISQTTNQVLLVSVLFAQAQIQQSL